MKLLKKDKKKSETLVSKISKLGRRWLVWCVIVLIILLLGSIAYIFYQNYKTENENKKYIELFEQSKQNYYQLSIENENLKRKLQELNLKLAETINSMADLQTVLAQMSSEKENLEDIKRQMEVGIKNTKGQLDKMQRNVNFLIDNRKTSVSDSQIQLLKEKGLINDD